MTTRLLTGGALAVLAKQPAGVFQCCVTSPPYYGLRDYHRASQIGLERTPEEYVAKLVEVFAEVWRVLRDDGTLWLNLGDSYNAAGRVGHGTRIGRKQSSNRASASGEDHPCSADSRLKPKDLLGIPWRVAFALQDAGWYLRSDIIWHKSNPMPESVTDRPTKSHEYLFLLAKQERYYYDAEAIKEIGTGRSSGRILPDKAGIGKGFEIRGGFDKCGDVEWNFRNRRSVWTIATSPYSGAHFATFPPALVEPCLLAGTSPQACEHCGAPWERVVEKTGEVATSAKGSRFDKGKTGINDNGRVQKGERYNNVTTGSRPTCACPNNTGSGACIVLDPFVGSGTTCAVAKRLGRSALGIDLNADYIRLARARVANVRIKE